MIDLNKVEDLLHLKMNEYFFIQWVRNWTIWLHIRSESYYSTMKNII